MPKIIAKQMAENPIAPYKAFVEGTVLPNAPLFANLTALGETVAGTFLVLGLFTGVGSLAALLLVLNYGAGQLARVAGQPGFHWTLFAVMIGLWVGRAGMTWGSTGCWPTGPGWWGSRRPWS
jgi:uncharacterized membrane protein YphA (DoxX/SURF4 family)